MAPEHHQIADRKVERRRRRLRHHPEHGGARPGAVLRQIPPGQHDLAGIRTQKTAQQSQQRRFPRAVRAQHHRQLAPPDRQGNFLENSTFAIAEAQLFTAQHRPVHHSAPILPDPTLPGR
ncbi:hypothetical protein SDC9_120202 [bioreactor metagenome]|uniref:Uncharacterized protein n=1 Tax=bioreactor metagenome TaxID=1076179 RepID=A0A645C612_9ZZZZ